MIESYDKLPIGKYMDITSIVNDTSRSELDRQVQMLSVLSGMDEDDILNAPITDFTEMSRKARFLESPPQTRPEIQDAYDVGSFRLLPVRDARKMTTAQYIDFQSFGRDASGHIVEMLSCLLVPEGCRYNDGYDVLDVQAAIREHMCCVDALAVYAFFLDSLLASMRNTLTSCRRELKTVPMEETKRKELQTRIAEALKVLRSAGAGSPASTRSRRRAAASGTKSGK